MRVLGTGEFVSRLLADSLPLALMAPITFVTGAIISFTTGTSWGTFSLLTPIAMPLSVATGIDPALLMAAVIGGGVFGDHCSPISDTTIVASMASGLTILRMLKLSYLRRHWRAVSSGIILAGLGYMRTMTIRKKNMLFKRDLMQKLKLYLLLGMVALVIGCGQKGDFIYHKRRWKHRGTN